MEMWERELSDMLDQVADYAEDYPKVLDMVAHAEADATECGRRKTFFAYIRELVTRLKRNRSQFNTITYIKSKEGPNYYRVKNYNYKMYEWYIDRKFPMETVTPDTLNISEKWLTEEERQSFRERATTITTKQGGI